MQQAEGMTYYVVMVCRRWTALDLVAPHGAAAPLALGGAREMGIGFMPIFESREAAESAFPGREVMMMKGEPDREYDPGMAY